MSYDEIRRIKEVYSGYDSSASVQARRNAANPGNLRAEAERAVGIGKVLGEHQLLPLTDRIVLDLGCGRGNVLASLTRYGARSQNLLGWDLLPDRVEAARRAYPDIRFECGNAEHLPFEDSHFDLIMTFTVFSSILDGGMRRNVAQEVRRVLRPGGAVLWFDFRYNNPQNPHTRGMNMQNIRSLFPGFESHLRTIGLLPPLARRFGPLTPLLYPLFATLRPLRTHYLGLLVKPKENTDA
ncbi:MAG: class I SAM-dependent methyltransferase [Chloroflexi bacterium]|nr:class I SAM-dependent methyltransferase [Chloroflexota bacterium]